MLCFASAVRGQEVWCWITFHKLNIYLSYSFMMERLKKEASQCEGMIQMVINAQMIMNWCLSCLLESNILTQFVPNGGKEAAALGAITARHRGIVLGAFFSF